MNRKTQIVLLMTLCMALLLAWGGLGTVSAQIGVSFNNGDGSLTADMAAGLFPYANWNLTTDASNTATGLVDSSGAATGASITWDSSGLYGTNAGTATPDRRMFQGQIWSSGSPATHAVSFTGIPYGSYAALIYVVNDNTGHYPYKWDVNGNLATEVYALHLGGGELQNGVWLRAMGTSLATANIANYVYFPNLSGADVTFNYTNLRGDNNAMICGIQIIPQSLIPVDSLTDELPLITPTAGQTSVYPRAVPLAWHYRKVLYVGGQFKVYLKAGSAPGAGDVIATLPENPKTYVLPALLPSTTYYWKVEVFQGANSKFSEVRTFITDADRALPAIPTTGCILHLDGSAGVLNGSGLPAANGEKVATWQDQSGAGNHVTQVTDANRPVYLAMDDHGRPGLRFTNASAHYLISANTTTFAPGTGEFDVILFGKKTTQGWYTYCGNRNSTDNGGLWLGWNSNGGAYGRVRDASAGANTDYAFAPAVATPRVLTNEWVDINLCRRGGNAQVSVNNVLLGSAANVADVVTDREFTVGNAKWDGNAQWWMEGGISEMFYFNRGLTDPEKTQIYQYLVMKYTLDKPTASMVSPAANANVSNDENVVLRARVFPFTGSTVSNVEFFVNGVSVGSTTTPHGSVDYELTWHPTTTGSKTVVAVVTDSNGLQCVASVAVNSLEMAPSVAFATPSPTMSASGPVDFPTTFTAVGDSFALTADKVTLAASEGSVTGTVSIVAGLLPRTPTIRVTGITGFGRLRVCVVAGAGTSPYGLGDTPTAVSPSAGIYPVLPSPPTSPVAGSKLWWDASNINGANNVGLNNGDRITSWKDRSGNSNDGTPLALGATYTASVADFNNKPAVTFHADRANELYNFTTGITDVRTVFWAIQKGDAGLHYILGCNTAWGGGYGWHGGDIGDVGDGEQIWHRDYAAAVIQNGVTRVNGDAVNGAYTSMYPLGHTIISLEAAGDCTADFFCGDGRGAQYNTRSWIGDLAELIIYNRVLTEQERNDTGRYLSAKYGKATSFGFPQVPTVELVYPTVGAIVLPSDNVALKATATGGSGASIASVEFYADGVLVGTATTRNALGQYVVSWTSPATEGRVLIFARALDNLIPTAAAGVSAQVYLSVVNPMFATVTGAGTHGGASWVNAMTLDEAITAAGAALVMPPIYVKTGTYPRAASYTFTKGMALYGGFAGTETKAALRTGTPGVDNVTTLDAGGAVAGIFNNGGQSITLDRLTFTRSADTAVRLTGGTDTVNNCSFTNNAAVGPGGGIYVTDGNTVANVTRCVFKNNTAGAAGGEWGGAIALNNNASFHLMVDSCWFEANQAVAPDPGNAYGGAICAWWADSVFISNSVFVGNISRLGGGAIELDGAPGGIFNNTFYNNQSTETNFPCILQNWNGVTIVVNNIFSTHTGNVVAAENDTVPANVEVRNNLLFNSTVDSARVTESGTVTGNPLFVNTTTDFGLQTGSPAIKKGLTGSVGGYDVPTMDYAGRTRSAPPDLGAFEIPVVGRITVTPDPLNFGVVAKETTSTKTLTLANTGGNTPLTISAIALTGDTQFSLVSPPTLPVTLLGGESLDIVVAFTAPVVITRVPYAGTVTVTNDGTVTPATGSLRAIAAPSLFPGEQPTVVVERSVGTPATTKVFPIEFNITFSEGVTGFALSDIQWSGTVPAGNVTATLIPREATGAQYTVRITAITGASGTINPVVPAAVCETIGKYANLLSNTDAVVTYETSLFGAVITTTASDITDAATVTCTVTFNAEVNAVDALALIESKLGLAGTSTGATIASVLEANPSTAYTVEITTGGDGTLALTLNDDDTIANLTDAPLNGANAGGSELIYGPVIEVDKTAPTVVAIQRAFGAARGTNAATVTFRVTFSDIVTGVDVSDFAIACSDATADVASVSTLGNTALVVCNVKAAVGPYALSVKTAATITNRVGLGYETATPNPNEDYYILKQAPQTSVETWSWTLY